MNSINKVAPLTEGSVLAALTVVLGIAIAFPVVGFFAALCWSVPLTILVTRRGLRPGLLAAAVSGILLAMLMDPTLSLRLMVLLAPPGIVLGYGFHAKWPAAHTFLATFAVSLVSTVAGLGLVFLLSGINPLGSEFEAMRSAVSQAIDMQKQSGLSEAELAKSKQQLTDMMDTLSLLAPTLLVLTGLMNTVVTYLLGRFVLKKLGMQTPSLPPFGEWRLPSFFFYLFGFGIVGLYWGQSRELDGLYQLALNANFVAMAAGLVQGISLLHCFFHAAGVRRFWRVFIYIFIALNLFVMEIIAFSGLIDMFFNYRGRIKGYLERRNGGSDSGDHPHQDGR